MERKVINWMWEDKNAQESFIKWQGMPDETETKLEVDYMEKLISIKPPLKILDVGCGTGRHAIEFFIRGYMVDGIDVAENYLNVAIERAKKENFDIKFEIMRGSDLQEEKKYDFAYAYNHTIGFMSENELKTHFKNIFESLKVGGKFFLRTAGPKITPNTSSAKVRNWGEKENEFILSEKYIENGYRYENCIVINIENNEIVEYREKQKAFSFDEEIEVLKNAGFKDIVCYQDLNGNEANKEKFGIYCCIKQ